jgi:hypothetical protein
VRLGGSGRVEPLGVVEGRTVPTETAACGTAVQDAFPITNLEAAANDGLAALLADFSRSHGSDESSGMMRRAHRVVLKLVLVGSCGCLFRCAWLPVGHIFLLGSFTEGSVVFLLGVLLRG